MCACVHVGGEGREKKLADIDRCEKQAAQLVQQATSVVLSLVSRGPLPVPPPHPLPLKPLCCNT